MPSRADIARYVRYIHREANGTILGQWVCVNPPSLGEFINRGD